ncbi:MAG: hypothetical protein QM728_00135 [Gordonia sp. (in: high G+C Gram-positive bacteria)]|uniref:hypothetical protein n=1 Tax=Gordonia sp. (in: high G+C Gram-positive bacteria) TaxID=84139 RepID=UPI0039E434A7
MSERRGARFGRVVLAGPGANDSAVLERVLVAEGFAVSDGGPAAVGLWCFDVAADPPSVVDVRRLAQRCDAVALVGCGIEDCPTWPARVERWCDDLDPHGALPVFAVALGLPGDGPSGVDELLAWADEQSTACAAAKLSRRDSAERLTGLRVGSAAVRTWAGGAIHTGFRELAAVGGREAAVLRAGDVDAFTRWLRTAVDDFETRVVDAAAGHAQHLRATATVGLDAHERQGPPPGPARTPVPWPGRGWGAEDAVIVVLGASSGLGIGRLVAGSMSGWLPGWWALLLATLLGVAVAGGVVALRRRVALRGQARAWVAEVVADARARTEWRVAALLSGVEPAVVARVRRAA